MFRVRGDQSLGQWQSVAFLQVEVKVQVEVQVKVQVYNSS